MDVEVRIAKKNDWNHAMSLAKRTFCACNYMDCTEAGGKRFLAGLENTQLYQFFLRGYYPMLCAYNAQQLVGMITIRNDNHISLLFVEQSVQGQKVGTRLLQSAMAYCRRRGQDRLTVNASRVAVSFYEKNGFYIVTEEYQDDGVYVTPMRCDVS